MRSMRWIYFFAVWSVALTFSVALAVGRARQNQQGTPTTTPAQVATVTVQDPQPKPGAQIERLSRALGGPWAITEKFPPDGVSPKGATAEGRIVWRPGPGGFSIIEDYQSKQGSKETTGLAVFWWDDAAQGYRTIWCDSTNPGGCISFKNTARWEGSQLVLVEDYESNGKKVTFKEVFGDITSSTFTQTLYGGPTGGELKIDQTLQATKLTRARSGELRK